MRKLVLIAALGALLASATAQAANPIQQGVLMLRVVDAPRFLPVTATCPVERLHTVLRTEAGDVIGSNDVCYTSASVSGGTETLGLVETFLVPGGMLETQQTLVLSFGSDGAAASSTRTVTRATGIYLGDTGTVTGTGIISVTTDGTVQPDLTFTLTLG